MLIDLELGFRVRVAWELLCPKRAVAVKTSITE